MAGERPPSADFQFGWWYAGAGQRFTGSADMILGVEEENILLVTAGSCAPGVYKFGPGSLANQCDMFHFWSPHTGGANWVFADGSVHFIPYSADSVLPALATYAGKETDGTAIFDATFVVHCTRDGEHQLSLPLTGVQLGEEGRRLIVLRAEHRCALEQLRCFRQSSLRSASASVEVCRLEELGVEANRLLELPLRFVELLVQRHRHPA